MPRYLSPAWIDRLRERAGGDEHLRQLVADRDVVLQQVVTGTPDGEVAYAVTFDRGDVHVQAGRVDDPDVTFRQSWDTAVEVATGELTAVAAFRDGLIELSGDAAALQANQDAFRALDAVFADVRADTTYE